MATSSTLSIFLLQTIFFSSSSHLPPLRSHPKSTSTANHRRRPRRIGDFVGNMSTEHKILIPHAQALALSQQNCVPISTNDSLLSKHDAKQLLFKVVGWRLVEEEDTKNGNIVMKLQCLWKLKDVDSGKELIRRINDVAEKAGHYPEKAKALLL